MNFTEGFESVSVNQVCKHYGDLKALTNVNLKVEAGEFMSLLGPSGSGKTTLLSILGGFIRVSSGSILFGNRDVTLMPPHKREIGVVFQNYALFPHMTVGENVAFPLRARGESASKSRDRVKQALATVELTGYENRSIAALSGGQRQRVALARAIVFEPKLILMDEPLSALDKQLRETMQIELRALHKRLGATMIYVTHDQREALTMSDRVAIMRGGQLVQVDTPGACTTTHPMISSPASLAKAPWFPCSAAATTASRWAARRCVPPARSRLQEICSWPCNRKSCCWTTTAPALSGIACAGVSQTSYSRVRASRSSSTWTAARRSACVSPAITKAT